MPVTKIDIGADAETVILPKLRELAVVASSALACPVDADALRLLVTELAANSIQAGAAQLHVSVELAAPGELHVEVTDDGHGDVAPRRPSPTDAGGRGLMIVDAMSSTWGIRSGAPAGSAVWFRLLAS